ncbi:MAG: hypothetical protein ACD_15C00088G0001 [uncultured bacterium]|nr:MAG: hypothetical protein ACD_15C00088G0001 [uncultured bacterium]
MEKNGHQSCSKFRHKKMKFIKFFILGALAALGALTCELVLSSLLSILFNVNIEKDYLSKITFFLIIVVIIEELFKLALLAKLFSSIEKSSSKFILSIFFGGGFAFIEVYLKLISLSISNIFSFPFLGVFLIHIITSGIIGYFLIKKSYSILSAIQALLISSLFHLTYNLLVIYNQDAIFAYIYLFSISILLFILKINLQNKSYSTIIKTR